MASTSATNSSQSDQVATDVAFSRIRAAVRSHNSPTQWKSDTEIVEDIVKILTEYDATTLGTNSGQGSKNIDDDLDILGDNDAEVIIAPVWKPLFSLWNDTEILLQDSAVEPAWQPGLQASSLISSHPRDFAPYDHHIDEIETFEKDLLEAKSCSDVIPVRYTKVEVILITWKDNDDIAEEVEEEVKELTKLFKKLNYTIKPYRIPDINCQNNLLFEVLSFLKPHQNDPSDETLLIVYYNGHGSIRGDTSYWHP